VNKEFFDSILIYEPDTGNFYWKISRNNKTKAGVKAGYIDSRGYVMIMCNKKQFSAHRLAWLAVYGKFPDNMIDHKNCVRHDNRIENLREATFSENNRNASISSKNTSGYKGVWHYKKYNKWRAEIQVNKKKFHLGLFETKEEAHAAYVEAAKKYHGEFARVK
jgi:hypothetical protein